MLEINQVNIVGNVADNPKVIGKGTVVLRIGNHDYKETTFVDIHVYDSQAEKAMQMLSKGILIYVEGKLKQRKYLNRDNREVTTYFIQGYRWQFVEPKKDAGKPRRNR